jgi:hypothetical protein
MSFEKVCKKFFEDTSNKGLKPFLKNMYDKKQLMICCVNYLFYALTPLPPDH